MRYPNLWAVAFVLCVGAASLSAQDAYTYKTETHLIDMTMSVHDAQGALVQGLTQQDFKVVEDGVPQQIRFFAHEAQLPLSIGLIVDASGSQEAFVKAHEKVLLILSDGQDNSSEHDLVDAIEEAQNTNVVVYAVRYTDAKHDELNARDRYGVRALDHLTAQAGGKTYDVHRVKVEQAFAEIAGEVRSLYELAYQSTNRERDGTFRKVQIQAVRPDIVVRSRSGYYAR